MSITRRDAIKLTGTLAAAATVGGCSSGNTKVNIPKAKSVRNLVLGAKKANRVVVVGGGWSGLSIAKNLKIFSPNTEIVLVEQRDQFISCPMSNLWLADRVTTEYITHDYLQAARENNYTFFHATAIDMDKTKKILHTTRGDIDYDYIVFAPGIDYDYSFITDDISVEQRLRQEYPAGFKPNEHLTLKNKIQNFKGGNFIMTVPSGNYRCMPAPYERACIVADYFKSKKLDAKILLLDENNDITTKEHGFHTAFDELYGDYLEYHPNSKIEYLNLDEKIVETEWNEFIFEDASFYPHVRGAKILETVGIAKDSVFNKLEGDIDGITYEVKGYNDIYISGDARPMGFSKSGNTSNTEGIYVAQLIANKIANKPQIKWQSPTTLCFSAVTINPERAIVVNTQYAYDKKTKRFRFDSPKTNEIWKGQDGLVNAKSQHDWADAMYRIMFEK